MTVKSLFWIEIFLFLSIMMVIFVPRPRIIRLLPYGLVAGFGLSLTLVYLLGPVAGLWRFNYPGPLSIAGIPVFASLAWTPVEIVFAHWLYRSKYQWKYYAFWAGISLFSASFTQGLVYLNYLVFSGWNFYYTLLVDLILHVAITYYLARVQLLDGETGEEIETGK